MIGKIILDKFGEKVLGKEKEKQFDIIPKVKPVEIDKLQEDIAKCNTTVEVKAVVDKNGWQNVKDLQAYIDEMYNKGEVDNIDRKEINDLITAQNNKNIAKQAKGFSGVNTAIKEYNKLSNQASRTQLADTIAKENSSLGAYLNSLNGAKAGMDKYAKALVTSTVKTAALQAATAALNGLISFGVFEVISMAFSAGAKAIDNYIHRVEKAKEAIEESRSEYESTVSELESMKSELKTTEEKIDELNNKPSLSFTDQEELERLKAQNQELEKSIALKEKQKEVKAKDTVATIRGKQKVLEDDLNDNLENLKIEQEAYTESKKYYEKNLNNGNLDEEQIEYFENEVAADKDIVVERQAEILKLAETLEKNKQSIIDAYGGSMDFSQWEEGDVNLYNKITSQLQKAYKAVYSDAEYNKFVIEPIFQEEKLIGLQEKLIQYFVSGGSKDTSTLEEQFGTDIITALRNACERAGIDFDKLVGDIYKNANSKLDQIAPLVEKPNGKADAQQNTVSKQIRDFIQNDLSEEDRTILLNAEIPEEAKFNTIEDVKNFIAKLKEESNPDIVEATPSTKFTKKNWNAIANMDDGNNGENKNIKEAQASLQELAETGKLTVDTFNETPDSDALLSYFGLTADEAEKAVKKINGFIDDTKQLNSMRTGITNITSNYDTKKNSKHKVLSGNDLETTYDTLGISTWGKEDLKVWEEYKNAAGDASISMSDFKDIQDKLATSFVNNGNYLANVTNETKDRTIAELKEMGVLNAEQVVTEALNQKTKNLATEKLWNKTATISLAKATQTQIDKEVKAHHWSEETKNALYRLALAKQTANGTTLDFSGDLSNIITYVEALGVTATALRSIQEMKSIGIGSDYVAGMPSDVYNKSGAKEWNEARVKQAYKEFQTALNNIKLNTSRGDKSNDEDKSKKKGSSSSKPTGTVNKSTKEKINWMERAFNVISQKIDLLKSKFENLFDIDLKTNNINQQVNQVNKDLNTTSKAIELYTKKYKALGKKKVKVTVDAKTAKGKKAKTKKISIKKYLKKAKNGGNSIQKVYGEQADLISQYEEYYDLVTEMRKKQQEDIASLYDLEMQKISAVTDYYDTYIGRLEAAKSIITSTIDLQSKISGALGGAETGTKSQYISQLNKQAEITQKQKEQYNKTVNARNKGAKQLEDSNTKDRKKLVKSLNKQVKKKKITKKEKQQRLDDFDNAFKDTKKKYDYKSATEVDNAKAAWIDSIREMLDTAQSLENISLEEFAIQSEKIEKEISALNSALGRTSEASLSSMEGVNAYNKALEAENQKRYDAYQTAKSALAAATSHKNAYAKELASLGVNASTIKTAENLEGLSTKQQQVAVKYLASMDAIHEATDNLSDASNEYLDTISENSQNMLDNIKSYFDKIDEDIQHKMDVSDAKLKSANNQGLREKYITDSYQGKLDQTENHENERKTNLDGLWDDTLQLNSAALNPTLKPVLDKIGFFLQGNSIKPHILTADDQKVLQEYGGTLPKWFSEAIIDSSKRLETDKTLEQQKELDDASAAYLKHEWYQQIFDSRNEQYTRNFENAANGQAAIEKIEDVISNLEAGGRRVDADKYQEESKAYHVSAALAKQYGDELWEYIHSRTDRNSADYDETFKGSDTYYNMVEAANAWYDQQTEAEINSIEKRHKAWQTRIEDFNRGWDDVINGIERTINYMDQNISILETKGHYINAQFYNNMANVYNTQLEQEKKHNKELQDKIRESVDSGDLERFSDEWYDLMDQLYSSDESIMGLTQSCAEMAKSARDADRELHDVRISAIDNLLGEAEFFQNLASREKQFDEDTGAITEHGIANFALGFAQIDDEEAKIKEYQESLAKLEEQYANNEIGAKEYHGYLDQYNESIQNSITNINSLKDALKSLAEEGLNAQLDALKELCDKYKDTLNEAKNLRDYQNTIEEQTKAKESLEKQLAVVQQMNTEEGRSKAQSLLVQLDEANKALEETEYDKYISDQENLIDEFQSDFEDFISEQLEYTDALLENIRDAISGLDIQGIINTINGYTIPYGKSMTKFLESQIGKYGTDIANDAANKKNEEYNQTPPVVIEQPNHDDLIYFKGSNSTETSRTPEKKTQNGASNYPGKIAGEMYTKNTAATEDGSKKAQTGTYTKGISTTSASRENGLASLKVGEAVLTPVEFNNLQKLTDSLGDLNFVMDLLHQLSDPPQSISTVNANKTIEIGAVNWNVSGTGIVDGDTFAKRMSNDSKFHKFMGDYVTDYFTGDSKSRRY